MATIKDSVYNAPTAFTITVAGLASSTTGAGQQSGEVDNTTTRFNRLQISTTLKLGSTPTAGGAIYVYLLRDNNDATPIRDDNAGTGDAAITVKNAQLIGTLQSGQSPATGDILSGNFIAYDPGPKWAIAVVNSTGSALDATAANHHLSYAGITLDES